MIKVKLIIPFAFLLAGSFFCPAEIIQTNKEVLWDFIKTNLVMDDYVISTFKDDIRIQISGNYTKEDSLCVANLAIKLKDIIKSVDVSSVSNKGNLNLRINFDTTKMAVLTKGILYYGGFSCSDTDGALGGSWSELNFDS